MTACIYDPKGPIGDLKNLKPTEVAVLSDVMKTLLSDGLYVCECAMDIFASRRPNLTYSSSKLNNEHNQDYLFMDQKMNIYIKVPTI